MERDAWNKQNRQKRFQGMGFPVKEPNEYACIVLKSLFCTIGWYLFLSVQLSVQNFPTESFIVATADLSASLDFPYPDEQVKKHQFRTQIQIFLHRGKERPCRLPLVSR